MTFVLCRILGPRIFILADTRVTKGNSPLPKAEGVIKTCFLSPDICVSFSQSPDSASDDIRKLASELPDSMSYRNVIDFFERSSAQTNNDYLVAFARTGRVAKIQGGIANKVLGSNAWIGDHEAFHRFRDYENGRARGQKSRFWDTMFFGTSPDASMDSERFARLLGFYEATIVDTDIESTGDFFTVTTNVHGIFKLMMISRLYFDGPSQILDSRGNHVMTATGENLEYRFSSLAPKVAGTNAAGFYYPNAKMGYVFYSSCPIGVANRCKIYRDCSIDELIASCKKDIGVEFDFVEAAHQKPGN
jgi:hypothetical protein